jgi:Na+-driven multidrug efflux pump
VILSTYVPLFGVFQGTRHSGITAFTALTAFVVRLIVTYWFKDRETFGHTIIWWNSLFGFCTGCLICWTYYFSRRWLRDPALSGTGKSAE